MADKKGFLEILIDLVALGVDLSTKSAVSRLGAGGGFNFGGRPLTGTTARTAGFFSKLASELGWGWEDEGGFIIEVGKLTDADEKSEINNLIKILNKRQLARIRLIVHNAPGTPEKTKTTPEKKAKDGTVISPEKVDVVTPKQSGGVLFLSALAKLLMAEKTKQKKIALLQKLNHLPTTKSFVEAAEEKAEAALRNSLGITVGEELTVELVAKRLFDKADSKAVKVWLKKQMGPIPDVTKPRPKDSAGPIVRFMRNLTPGSFPNGKQDEEQTTRGAKIFRGLFAVLVAATLGTSGYYYTLTKFVHPEPSLEEKLINRNITPAETPANVPAK